MFMHVPVKSHLVVWLSFLGIALLGCSGGEGGGGGEGGQGGDGQASSQCDELRDEASPGNVVFKLTNKRATPIYYDDNGECSRAFRVSEGDAMPQSPGLTGWPTCGWYMDNDDQGPLDCLSSELKTLGPNESVELTWDGRVLEHHDLPAECQDSREFPPACDKLVALDAGTLTAHVTFWGDQDCTNGMCAGIDHAIKQQTFSFPAAGSVDIAVE
ncbi:hypothetical protein [Sorangium sp. So ce1389]|uniref:hypothetical protein n=1 Tax=Sorangium sp. So ce1389 TaxID=3133336 RepID=UPI003F5F5C97